MSDNEIEIDDAPAYYDYGCVLNETIVKLFGDICSFNKLKKFYDNPSGEVSLEIRRSKEFFKELPPTYSTEEGAYFIDVDINGERFLETKEYQGSYLNATLAQLTYEMEEAKRND
jgi:hypothetical protein